MKKLISLICGFFFLLFSVQAQFKKVPASVTSAFATSYPTAKNISWKSGFSGYEANFEIDGDHGEAKYGGKGEWKETTIERKFASLPAEVRDGFAKSKFPDWHIRDCKEIREKGKETLYRLYVSKSDLQKKYLYFNGTGQLVKDAITL